MAAPRSHARLVHAVPGRLRVRLHDGVPIAVLDGLGAVRVAPGVLAVEVRAAARSVVVRYHPARTSADDVLVAVAQSGVLVVWETVIPNPAAKTSTPRPLRGANGGFADSMSGAERGNSDDVRTGAEAGGSSGTTLRELLIGPPPKLDRRFAESLALSAVSLVGARQIGMALGGSMTLPAYFVIWLTLRRLTGAGRRR